MGRSRGGLTTKIHAVVDAKGLPIRLGLTPGQAYDGEAAMELLNALPENAMVLADKAYDANAIREMINGQGAWANIPPKSNRKDPICFSPYLYKARNLVERFFNKIKHFPPHRHALRQAGRELHGHDQTRVHSCLAASL